MAVNDHDWAVVISVSDYEGATAKPPWITKLKGPDNDAAAIATWLIAATQGGHRPIAELEPVTSPPMLWRSWLLLIEASNDRPDLLPADTWRPLLQVLPVRPFLAWSQLDDEKQAVEAWRRSVAPFVHASLAPGEDEDAVMSRLTTSLLAPRSALEDLRKVEPA